MPPRQHQTRQAHRVVCTCVAYECSQQQYPDANGTYHPGVEVLPETRAAHQRADFRNSLPKSPRTPGHSNESSINLAQDNLLSPLRQLRITSSPSTPRNDQHVDDELTHGRSSIHHSSQPDEETSSQAAEVESPTIPATDSLPKSQKSTKTCSEAALAKSSGQTVFDCDRFHGSDLKSANPLILHTALTASILDIFGQSSNSITKWFLDIQIITIELSTTYGILPTKSSIRQILPEEAATLKKIPSSATTTFRWLKLDPVLQYLNCCSSCFAMYPENSAPPQCHHRIANIPGGPSDSVDPNNDAGSPPSEDNDPEFSDSICGEPLFKYVRGVQKPARRLSSWHVRRFWAMKDLQNDEEKLPPISTVELLKLVAEHSEPLPHRPNSPALDSERDPEGLDQNINDVETNHVYGVAQMIGPY
ncbi:uncharacterized protein MELLADRAFT_114421 [Melampsora larici-populina 98AG31]|uniref:Uncharacterized protein n=1 Tax=Melampsora larici-populina (strain 98AG31 / pathotype 3-4-7) TaxID=747676 RepID=F4SDE1_MELLP|nr:uncharacterized protein MELLADRAFT_114421 [Melampsora larici-populina 98AG31]EGF97337.1 hypothetical protein MELLADRAFT_114421 [Melampsora larici-populina 98AG31]